MIVVCFFLMQEASEGHGSEKRRQMIVAVLTQGKWRQMMERMHQKVLCWSRRLPQ
jgi:hypothetical protein